MQAFEALTHLLIQQPELGHALGTVDDLQALGRALSK